MDVYYIVSLFQLQLKLKNSIDVGIINELTSATLTEVETSGEENLTIQSKVFNQEGRSDDKVQEGKIDEEGGAERDNRKLDLPAERKDDNKNGHKTQQSGRPDDNRTSSKLNYTLKLNAGPTEDQRPGVCEQEDHQGALLNMARGADDISHPCSSSGVSSKNTEVTIITKSDFTNDGNGARHQGKESEIPQVAILSGRLEKTNTDTTLDKCTPSQQGKTRQVNPASAKNTNEGKKRPVVSTLAVPSIKYSRVLKRKDLPSPPECGEETGQNDTLETDLTATNMETTEVMITIHNDDEQLDNSNGDDDNDDISAEDLLCFSWQIAQGMVSRQPKRAVGDNVSEKKKL